VPTSKDRLSIKLSSATVFMCEYADALEKEIGKPIPEQREFIIKWLFERFKISSPHTTS
jgi:hypothetical protein